MQVSPQDHKERHDIKRPVLFARVVNFQEQNKYCKEKIANYKCPRMVFFWDELPKTATGKIQKNKIVDLYLKQQEA